MKSSNLKIIVTESVDDMAQRVAAALRGFSWEPAPHPFSVALCGGNTPKRLYQLLAGDPGSKQVRWEALELFFGDERAVPPDHPESNYGMVQRALLSQVPVRTHRMPAETGKAEEYQQLLEKRTEARARGIPVLDLILLGIGQDGHTASLFPDTRALDERSRWVVMNEVPQLRTRRMTFTYPLINAARRVWVLATGAEKREIVARCLAARGQPGIEKTLPILGVCPAQGELLWWLDKISAAGLENL